MEPNAFHRTPIAAVSRGFTLVEILIVVVILGIMAAIVVPQFSNASTETKAAATKAVLQTVRKQLEIYKINHQDSYPTLTEMWDNLVQATEVDGSLSVAGPFGPYLMHPPYNQFTHSITIVNVGSATPGDGWEYDEVTGVFTAVGFDEATDTFTPLP